MKDFNDYLESIDNGAHRAGMEEILSWIIDTFPNLGRRIAWGQPMFTDHGTFIIGFSIAKHHIAVSPEKAGLRQFSHRIAQSGYETTKEIFRIKWDDSVDYALLADMIKFNIKDKTDCTTFWRK